MPFGEIFTGAFSRIWRHKSLWLLAMIGLALSGLGTLVSLLLTSRWMSSYLDFMGRLFRNPGATPDRALRELMNSMGWIWAASALLLLLGLLGYVLNLVARAGIINEASFAWRNQRTSTGRGLREGAQRAVHVLLLDLMWFLPGLLLGLGALIAFFVLLAGTTAASDQNTGGGLIASSWLVFACCGACIALLYYLVYAIFSPLMYQSAVAGRRAFGAAVTEGWGLARANLGAMIIFWLLLLLVGFVLTAFQQALGALLSLPMMSNWFEMMNGMMQGFGRGAALARQTMNGPLFVIFGLVSAVISFLITTFTQTLNLTLYGGVYEHLTGVGPAAPVDVVPEPAPPAPAPVTPVEPEPLVVPPPAAREDEPPPTL